MLQRGFVAKRLAGLLELGRGAQPASAVVGLQQVRGLKEDTGIVGLAVDPNARENLR